MKQETGKRFFETHSIDWGYRLRSETFSQDSRKNKIDLAAGVIRNSTGEIHSFKSVDLARQRVINRTPHTGYLPPAGFSNFRQAIQSLILKDNSVTDAAFTIQTLGAAGALNLIAKTLQRLKLVENVFVANETWRDHGRIFQSAGMNVSKYPYLQVGKGGVDFDGLLEVVRAAHKESAIILQLSCHNPTGYDLTLSQWSELFDLVKEKGHLPILDVAYLGFAKSVEEDLLPINLAQQREIDFIVATSCGKMFSRFDERLGALTVSLSSVELAKKLESQFNIEIQASYSSPPYLMAAAVAELLEDQQLRQLWLSEQKTVREMISVKRRKLVTELAIRNAPASLLAIGKQLGSFAWTGFNKELSRSLWNQDAINIPSNGRICLSALQIKDCSRLADVLIARLELDKSFVHTSIADPVLERIEKSIIKTPHSWLTVFEEQTYIERQAKSCLYLEQKLESYKSKLPTALKESISNLFNELIDCHQKQYTSLATEVELDASSGSFYFDQMYEALDLNLESKEFSLEDVVSLLCIHAVSYARGQERYALLRRYPENNKREIWHDFYYDAFNNATLVIRKLAELVNPNLIDQTLVRVVRAEAELMRRVWKYKSI